MRNASSRPASSVLRRSMGWHDEVMDRHVANAPRSDESCINCEAEDEYIVIARPQAVAIHGGAG
jgi:hypothetical protein